MVGIQKLWYKLSVDDLTDFFAVKSQFGLGEDEVIKRSKKFGFNDAKVFNKSSISQYKYKTLRNGRFKLINPNKLVLGDIVYIKRGDIIPADLRLIKVQGVNVNEERITGNYAPTFKNALPIKNISPKEYQKNMVFAGSTVLSGSAYAVVVSYQVPKKMQATRYLSNKSLLKNNVINNRIKNLKYLKAVNTVVFDDLQQEYEVIKTIQEIFIQKNITCIYFLQSNVLEKIKTTVPEALYINNISQLNNISNQVIIVPQPNPNERAQALRILKSAGFKTFYVYRGEEYQLAASIADFNLVINKNSSQESLQKASLITDKVSLHNLGCILDNNK